DFRALAWRPSPNGCGPRWVVPPLVEVVDFLEEEGYTALHTDSTAGQGLLALAAARLLHLPLTGAVDPEGLDTRPGRRSLAARVRRRYLSWFYGRLDEAYVPTRAAARALVAGGVDPGRIALLPALAERTGTAEPDVPARRS
ncbi:MAG TPA: glycosyltransferase, partial [Thermoleophilia bacterium]|nr:glycosyltransferase [Thermoleophilia bacterium]